MIEWSEQHELIRQTFRRFVEAEIKPNLRELEHGDTPPYAVLRKMMLNMDPPEHSSLRKIVNRAFTPQAIRRQLADAIDRHAREVVDAICETGETDYLANVAAVDAQRMAIVGYSLGAYLALVAAGDEQRCRAVVLASGGDLPEETP